MSLKVPDKFVDMAYVKYESQLEKEVMSGDMPAHIAIIMDGNRRFAHEMLEASAEEGHRLGKDKLNEVIHWCLDMRIRYLTVYAFSVENFRRDAREVEFLMDLLETSLYEFADDDEVREKGVSLRMIGDRSMLSESVNEAIDYAESKTKDHDNLKLNLAVAYGGRQEIVDSVRRISEKVRNGELDPDDIDEVLVGSYMTTGDIPDPDLILRTSGEVRISNFLLWQMAYSELFFMDVYWPSFRRIDLLRAVRSYQNRKGRYGK